MFYMTYITVLIVGLFTNTCRYFRLNNNMTGYKIYIILFVRADDKIFPGSVWQQYPSIELCGKKSNYCAISYSLLFIHCVIKHVHVLKWCGYRDIHIYHFDRIKIVNKMQWFIRIRIHVTLQCNIQCTSSITKLLVAQLPSYNIQ